MKEFQDTAKTNIQSQISFLLKTKGDELSIAIAEAGLGLRAFNVTQVFGKLPTGITETSKDLGESYRGGLAHQYGADYIVPPGFSNDRFGPIFVSSGERVTVTPPGMGGSVGGMTIVNQYINDSQAAAMAFSEVKRIRSGRLNSSMGVG